MPDGYAFSHDPERCIKCYTCELACKQWKGIAAGTHRLRRVYETTSGTFPQVNRTFHSVGCQHCPDAPCLGVCRPGALSKRADGLVAVDAGKCDGCRKCFAACPFAVPAFGPDRTLQLCDLCQDRLADGKGPLCSDVCPTGALRYLRTVGA
jgi:anaerobic dimethyl sulfoxide reductase subunit B (iron-sulfur subunit)